MDQQHLRLLAKLKLKAKKELNISMDLQAMAVDPAYAELILRAIKERALDEETWVAVAQLREALLPKAPPPPVATGGEDRGKTEHKGRDYRFGARGG